jgi:hypothetical protein
MPYKAFAGVYMIQSVYKPVTEEHKKNILEGHRRAKEKQKEQDNK